MLSVHLRQAESREQRAALWLTYIARLLPVLAKLEGKAPRAFSPAPSAEATVGSRATLVCPQSGDEADARPLF